MEKKTSRSIFYDYLMTYMHTPFLWKGQSINIGLDSSGFVVSALKGAGVLPGHFHANSQHLYNIITSRPVSNELEFGTIVFYGKSSEEIYHCGLMLNDELMIECGGGSSNMDSIDFSNEKDARVRVRPYRYRKDYVAAVRPSYKFM